jgi:hypothetical protein
MARDPAVHAGAGASRRCADADSLQPGGADSIDPKSEEVPVDSDGPRKRRQENHENAWPVCLFAGRQALDRTGCRRRRRGGDSNQYLTPSRAPLEIGMMIRSARLLAAAPVRDALIGAVVAGRLLPRCVPWVARARMARRRATGMSSGGAGLIRPIP